MKQSISHEKSFAEVIASSLDHFVAQSWKWDDFPDFGSLVQVINNDTVILGCVIDVQTGSMDPLRSPFPYKKTEEELLREQPQIFEFLRTTFKVQILGYYTLQDLVIKHTLYAKPTKIHSFVGECDQKLVEKFFHTASYLHLLFSFSNQIPNIDELLLAILHNLSIQQLLTQNHLETLCESYSLLIGNDYRRIKLFLHRVEQLL